MRIICNNMPNMHQACLDCFCIFVFICRFIGQWEAPVKAMTHCHTLWCGTQVKMHWVHAEYWKAGPDGNDIHKTNVPNLRMRYRYDCHTEEHNLVMQGARTFEARKAAKHRD